MAESKLGIKRERTSCGARLYDLGEPTRIWTKRDSDQKKLQGD